MPGFADTVVRRLLLDRHRSAAPDLGVEVPRGRVEPVTAPDEPVASRAWNGWDIVAGCDPAVAPVAPRAVTPASQVLEAEQLAPPAPLTRVAEPPAPAPAGLQFPAGSEPPPSSHVTSTAAGPPEPDANAPRGPALPALTSDVEADVADTVEQPRRRRPSLAETRRRLGVAIPPSRAITDADAGQEVIDDHREEGGSEVAKGSTAAAPPTGLRSDSADASEAEPPSSRAAVPHAPEPMPPATDLHPEGPLPAIDLATVHRSPAGPDAESVADSSPEPLLRVIAEPAATIADVAAPPPVAGLSAPPLPPIPRDPMSGRLAAGPVDRSPVRAPGGPPAEPVPGLLRHAVLTAHGVDVGTVRVHRDAAAEHITTVHGTRALTRGEEIFLPARHGPLDRSPADSLLAHELTHVVQQRHLGVDLPPEDSPGGQALEAQARAAALTWHEGGSLPPSSWPPVAPQRAGTQRGEVADMIAAALATTGLTVERVPHGGGVSPGSSTHLWGAHGVQRESEGGGGEATRDADALSESEDVGAVPMAAPPGPQEHPDEAGDGDAAPAVMPAPALTAPSLPEADLDRLARRLYQRVHAQIRSELLIDRERSGLLVDR